MIRLDDEELRTLWKQSKRRLKVVGTSFSPFLFFLYKGDTQLITDPVLNYMEAMEDMYG